jgi:hypothetical protein
LESGRQAEWTALVLVALVVATIFLDLLLIAHTRLLLSNPHAAVIWLSVNAD